MDFIMYLVLFSVPLFTMFHICAGKMNRALLSSVKVLAFILNFILFAVVAGLSAFEGIHLVDMTDLILYLVLFGTPFVTMIYLWRKK